MVCYKFDYKNKNSCYLALCTMTTARIYNPNTYISSQIEL